MLTASASGIFLKSICARETPSWAVQGIGQDIVNLVAAVVLFIAVYFVNKGSFKAFLVWSGILLYLIYAYVIYAFDVHFNSLFLMYVAILGLSFYALVVSVIHLNVEGIQAYFCQYHSKSGERVLTGAWHPILPALAKGGDPGSVDRKIPQSVLQANLPTNPVHVLDLGIYLPAMLITGLLLWRRKLLGYLHWCLVFSLDAQYSPSFLS